ncbi:hypothetical protein ACE1OE_23720 [Vibrio sp. E150_011]|uniref:hypothetical protein n=1 Tax=Vibrio sp. 10N.261.51.F12 TaxID=3229679 RepID=UPI003550E095
MPSSISSKLALTGLFFSIALPFPIYADVHNGPAAPAEDDISYQVYYEMLSNCIDSGGEPTTCAKQANRSFAQETQHRRENDTSLSSL